MAASTPSLRLSPAAEETMPASLGPAEQPRSPPRARRQHSAVPPNAAGQGLDAIAAVVIGGTSMSGGEGSMFGTLIGILIIGIIANGLNLLGVAQGPQKMVKGLIIVIAVIIDVIRRKASESAK